MKVIEANLPRNGNFTRRSKTDEVILHHAEASSATVWDINQWHLDNGWVGIGYHYYIRKDGSIYRGRPEWAVGAHATGHNDRSIGICCEGAYMTEIMPAAQLASLKALLRDIMGRYGALALKRHRDVNPTDCPGDNFPWEAARDYRKEEPEMTEAQVRAIVRDEMDKAEKAAAALPPKEWHEKDWEAAKEAGLMDGTRPRAPLTRDELSTVLVRCGLVGRKEG